MINQDNFAHVGSDEMVLKAIVQFLQIFCHVQPGEGSFGDKAVRRGFIRKVYAILMCQVRDNKKCDHFTNICSKHPDDSTHFCRMFYLIFHIFHMLVTILIIFVTI